MSNLSSSDRFAFIAEWFDSEASLTKTFNLFFFPFDDTLELYDIKNRRIFLRRTRCEGVTLNELFVGNTTEIFSRQMKIIDYGDEKTRNKMSYTLQKTFATIKPDGLENIGNILRAIFSNGFKISKLKMAVVDKDQALQFYSEHTGQSYLPYLMRHMMSGPVIAIELVAEDAINKWKTLVGPSDPLKAKEEAPDSLRACFGTSGNQNAVHAADTPKAVAMETELFFPSDDTGRMNAPKTSAKLENSTCCIVKPCAIKDGKLGEIVAIIRENHFQITAMEMFYLNHTTASEFFEIYNGVVPEYPAMVSHLASGPCVAMEIIGQEGDDVAVEFRKLVGPADPDVARQLRPHTLRARYGKNKIQNAIHVTDLPQDAPLEVQYFFKILSI